MRGFHELKFVIESIRPHIDDIIRRLRFFKEYRNDFRWFNERLDLYLRYADIYNLNPIIQKCYDLYFNSAYSEEEAYEIIHSAYEKSGLSLKIGCLSANEFFQILYAVYYFSEPYLYNGTILLSPGDHLF